MRHPDHTIVLGSKKGSTMRSSWIPCAVVGLWLIPLQVALGWGAPHHTISQLVTERLPAWQQELIKGQTKSYIGRYCLYPDMASAEDAKPYIMPDAGIRLHIPDAREKNTAIIAFYLPRVVDAFAANDVEQAMRWFGALTHYLEDSSCPGHIRYGMTAIPEKGIPTTYLSFVAGLMPMPDELRAKNLHTVIDGGGFTHAQLKAAVGDRPPLLLATSVEELTFTLAERHEQALVQAPQHLIPMLTAFAKEDKVAFGAAGAQAATLAVNMVSDALYTAICIAQKRIDPAEAARLPSRISLADIAPASGTGFTWNRLNYQGRPLRNASGTLGWASQPSNLKPQPLKLKLPEGGVKTFAKGWGVGVLTQYTFLLQPGVFRTFDVWVGNHAELGIEGVTSYEILLDGKSVAKTEFMRGDCNAQRLTVELGTARKLTIKTGGEGKSAKIHAVWANPVLTFARAPAKEPQD